jgi:hypothetical protein
MHRPTYRIIISTADRSPRRNYLVDTLNSLYRSGVFSSRIPHELVIVDTGKGVLQQAQASIWLETHGVKAQIHQPIRKNSTPDNAACGLKLHTASDWTIFLEDDIEVCGSFLESVDAWLRDHYNQSYDGPIYPLCAAYGKNAGRDREASLWRYGIGGFYGTQAYAIRSNLCCDLAWFLENEAAKRSMTNGHDLLLKEWIQMHSPNLTHLLCPGMDFVQHVGRESSIHLGRFHQYPHFGGSDWSYLGKDTTYYGPEELKRSKFSPQLAKLLYETLDKSLPVYDMGCGIGKYVSALEGTGFVAVGFEGHPQARRVSVTPSVISVDLSEPIKCSLVRLPRGSVVSLEVGEHVQPERSDTFLDNLSLFCAKTLVLSWAVRGQGGHRHINELDESEIVPRVESRGFRLDREKTDEWRRIAGDDLFWLKRSLYCFERA